MVRLVSNECFLLQESCVCVCVHACVRACVLVCMLACVCVCMIVYCMCMSMYVCYVHVWGEWGYERMNVYEHSDATAWFHQPA